MLYHLILGIAILGQFWCGAPREIRVTDLGESEVANPPSRVVVAVGIIDSGDVGAGGDGGDLVSRTCWYAGDRLSRGLRVDAFLSSGGVREGKGFVGSVRPVLAVFPSVSSVELAAAEAPFVSAQEFAFVISERRDRWNRCRRRRGSTSPRGGR